MCNIFNIYRKNKKGAPTPQALVLSYACKWVCKRCNLAFGQGGVDIS